VFILVFKKHLKPEFVYNITVKQYSQLDSTLKYDMILNHIKEDNKFLNKEVEIVKLPYNNIKYCLSLLQKVNDFDTLYQIFNIIFDCSKEDFLNADIVSYFKAKNYIINSFKVINENESRLSKSSNTDLGKWKMAGGDRLAMYDSFLPLDQLGERYGQYPMDLGRQPYSEIFYLMAMTKTLNEVNYNYNNMK